MYSEMMLSQTVTEVKLHLPMHRSRRTADSRYQRQSANNGKDVYQVNWIEQKGVVISQVINFKTHKVFAYMTWNKEGERGNRASIFHRGTFTIHEANK